MRPEDKWQKKRLGLVADAELTAEHLPEVVSINDDGEPTGIDTMTYIGILHNAIQELSAKVEALEGVIKMGGEQFEQRLEQLKAEREQLNMRQAEMNFLINGYETAIKEEKEKEEKDEQTTD